MKKIITLFILTLLTACSFPAAPIKLGEEVSPPRGFVEALGRGYLSELPKYEYNDNLTAEQELDIAEQIFVDTKYHDFILKSDQLVYGKSDYWATRSELEKNGGYGDCNNFAHWVRVELAKLGIKSYLVAACTFCDGNDAHAVVVTKYGYVFDNNLKRITTFLVQPFPYTLISSSGLLDDPKWYKVTY